MMHNLTQLFFVFPTKHNAHMPCETEKLTNVWQRRRQQGFILPPNIRLHSLTMPQLLQTFLLNSLSSHLQKLHSMTNSVHDAVCIALHCIALMITPATIMSQCLLWIFISWPDLCISQTNCSLGPHIIRGLSDGASVNKLNILVNNKKLQRLLKSCL